MVKFKHSVNGLTATTANDISLLCNVLAQFG